jgi:hypothetical protein
MTPFPFGKTQPPEKASFGKLGRGMLCVTQAPGKTRKKQSKDSAPRVGQFLGPPLVHWFAASSWSAHDKGPTLRMRLVARAAIQF